MKEEFRFGREFLVIYHVHDRGLMMYLPHSRQIKVNSLFNNYRIQSNANNEITVTLASEALLGALKSASTSAASGSSFNTEEIVVKLAKKTDHALLTFEIYGQTRTGNKMRVAHDVKIQVMKPADVAKLSEPLCPEPDVCVFICGPTSPN